MYILSQYPKLKIMEAFISGTNMLKSECIRVFFYGIIAGAWRRENGI